MRARAAGFSMLELLAVVSVMTVVLLASGQLMDGMQRRYDQQRRQIEAADNARAALDTIVRLLRLAGNNPRRLQGLEPIAVDLDGNGAFDTAAFQSDWNPADGQLSGPYENIVFFVADGRLKKREAGDPAEGVEFAAGIESLAFSYFDATLEPVSDARDAARIAYVEITLVMRPEAPGSPPVSIEAGAAVRGRE
jgi:type II secretory pathway pseudopilin PulG